MFSFDYDTEVIFLVLEEYSLNLTKAPEEDFGIETRHKRKENPYYGGNPFSLQTHSIEELWKGSPAYKSRLLLGEKVIQFNGNDASLFDYIGSLIRQSGNEVSLVIDGLKEVNARIQMENPVIYLTGIDRKK